VLKHGAFVEVDLPPLIRCGVDILLHPYIPVLPAPLRGARPGKNGLYGVRGKRRASG